MEPSLAYLAGFFDGEGNVGIYKGGGTGRTLRVQITQVQSPRTTELLQCVQTRWGGSMAAFNQDLRRPAWNLQMGGQAAANMLADLLPHLYLKRDQAELALLWFRSRPLRLRDPATGRHMARGVNDIALTERVAGLLKQMKWSVDGASAEDAEDLVEVRHMLRQVVNVKGD